MIRLSQVCKIYNKGGLNEFAALKDVSLTLAARRITVLKGPSGSGKTTLLSVLGCMNRPTSGRIHLSGVRASWLPGDIPGQAVDVTSLPERFLTEIRRHTFGFVFQHFNLMRGISVAENVMLPAYPTGEPRARIRIRAESLLKRFGIGAKSGQPVELLSGGEAQRAAMARALINDPAIVIADEPTAHLDSRLSQEFMRLAESLRAEGKTVVIASHDPLVFDSAQADAVLDMRDGALLGGEAAG